MRFKRITFNLLSPLIGVHVGRNPVSGQRFMHVAPVPFVGLDFELPPYGLNDLETVLREERRDDR
jgi:hypothetical protein